MVDLVPGTANRAVREVIDGKEVFTPIVQTDGGGGSGASEVQVVNFPATQPVSGPLTNAQLAAIIGTAAQTAIASAPDAPNLTVLSILRAMMSQNAAMLNLLANCVQELEAINANTTPTL
ncbi:hypothetical protein [Kerstersia gyiorum]|uniref:hypothetical protein n=1 Tax=Kerstersia gyiorum TaxID=206506 RepID=UPI00209E8632|nr:hypothetical protein [Kerstersia gyiorum]MCP1679420.1 hypothetical protein [Kerstersia gyiorum]MCP1823923.1 hypothetical protein [Kerstersia gyiorum]MCP1827364.1 hypothetical protein [Kerstersia gyiorum]MCW2448987.1 hypothetical protein [Kerstersia gyiorum]